RSVPGFRFGSVARSAVPSSLLSGESAFSIFKSQISDLKSEISKRSSLFVSRRNCIRLRLRDFAFVQSRAISDRQSARGDCFSSFCIRRVATVTDRSLHHFALQHHDAVNQRL